MSAAAEEWPVRLFRKSVLKQAKLAQILRHLGKTEGFACLDLGADNGVISLFLRRRGGRWQSADLDPAAVESIRSLVGSGVHLLQGTRLPFANAAFDKAVVVDMLEHVEDHSGLAAELARVVKPGGCLVTNTPRRKPFSPLRGLRLLIGQTDARHGHVRPGYTVRELETLFAGTFTLEKATSYSRFFSEAVDTLITLAYGAVKRGGGGSKGVLVTRTDLRRHAKAFRLYSILYPLLKLFAWLDRLLFFVPGFMLVARWRRVDPAGEAAS